MTTAIEPLMLSDFTVQAIPKLQEELTHQLSCMGTVRVDCSGVARPNTALLQLLAAFMRDLRAQSRSIEWSGESAALDRAARVLGLTASLGLPAHG